ncbi:MAG: AhpC/TSA family protein [Anaerolineae bacterium]
MGRRQAELTSLNTNVVLISFGTPYWAQVWREETGSPFPLLLDQERAAYRAYGLARRKGSGGNGSSHSQHPICFPRRPF